MKIIRLAKPGKIMKQPAKNPNSGKMDSQIFIGKKDPQHASKKKKKKNKKEKKASFNLREHREAKLSDFFGPSSEKFYGLAKGFIEDYFSRRNKTPTIGEVMLSIMKMERGVDQDFIKGVAASALSEFRNLLQEA